MNADGTVFVSSEIHYNSYAGRASVYKYENGSWVQKGQYINGNSGDQIGYSIGINADGNRIALGSIGYDSNRGKVCMYEYDGSQWVQMGSDIFGKM